MLKTTLILPDELAPKLKIFVIEKGYKDTNTFVLEAIKEKMEREGAK